MNLVLGDVQETRMISNAHGPGSSYSLANEDDTADMAGYATSLHAEGKNFKTEVRQRGMIFVRGDAIILVAPPHGST
jgi:small nuclear ribonucleoprotein (snRNP)-like protein